MFILQADRDEQKKPRESATGVTKRNEERPRESKSKEEEHAEKGKRIRKDEESVVRSEKKDVDKVSNVNKEEPIKKITHRRERDETNKSSVKDDSETKKLDEIKVSIENELASERKLDTSTSSTSGESHRDKPNITVELKYGGEVRFGTSLYLLPLLVRFASFRECIMTTLYRCGCIHIFVYLCLFVW